MFVLSGGTGLVDQLCFSKYLGTIVGSTAHAVSAVLAAFMTGLALGAHLGGRWSQRIRQPLAAYGALEILVAIAVAATPAAFGALSPVYVALVRSAPESAAWLGAARWLIAMLLVVAPTMAMGATLPFLSQGLARGGDDAVAQRAREERLAHLYAANTLGGALGALLAAYFVLPALGLSGTLFASAAVSAVLGVGAIALSRTSSLALPPSSSTATDNDSAPPASRARPRAEAPASRELLLLAALAAASGALVFTAEVIFTHLLALLIGNSVYAFGLILAIFLCCLFLGASNVERARKRFGEQALPVSLAATALALVVTLPLWDQLPLLFNNTGKFITSFAGREATRGFATLLILAVPTTLMGLTFPLLLQRVARYEHVGALVGRLTAVNTLGAVLGSLFAGYLLLPALGSEHSLMIVAGCFAVCAMSTSWALGTPYKPVLYLTGLTLLGALLLPGWNLAKLTAGTNVYFDGAQRTERLLMLHEDVQGGVTSVAEADGVRTLYTNGKFQGNTGWEMNAQRYFAHYPSLFVPRFDQALVIGLGTGTTTGTLAAYPWERIQVVEISRSIAEAARRYFADVNSHALDDPRVELIFADGRNHLLLSNQRYDLISIELSSIWFAGASSLYSSEFYELVAERLTRGGVLQQWVQLHHITPRDFATILHTMRVHFEHMALFYGGGQGILVASQQPLEASEGRARSFEQTPRVADTLPLVHGPGGEIVRRSLASLAGDALLVDTSLDRFLESVARQVEEPLSQLLSTDDNLYLEYATPRGNVLPWSAREELVADIVRYRDREAVRELLGP